MLAGASTRGARALMLTARALAVTAGRDYLVPGDVQQVAVAALAHRLVLRPETHLQRVVAADVVRALLQDVPVPATAAAPVYGSQALR